MLNINTLNKSHLIYIYMLLLEGDGVACCSIKQFHYNKLFLRFMIISLRAEGQYYQDK